MSMPDRTGLRALAGIVVLFALGGCAATNVGNTWQCPLVKGSVCASVAEADPAASRRFSTDTSAIGGTETQRSAVRARRSRTVTGARASRTVGRTRPPEPECRGVCRLQDWLGRSFGSAGEVLENDPETQSRNASEADELEPATSWRDSARTSEVLGRIWIAPYVDASGVYHEASWVRVVLEPAGWRKAR